MPELPWLDAEMEKRMLAAGMLWEEGKGWVPDPAVWDEETAPDGV